MASIYNFKRLFDNHCCKKTTICIIFSKTVDIVTKGDYYYLIVILHVYFARVAKGVEVFLGNIIFFKGE